jgi:arsenate reductase-like glutaredoxin family protein
LEASNITVGETVPASRKLGADDARRLLESASRLIAAKGKKVSEFKAGATTSDEAVAAMLGPTGNLRAPTLKVGKTVLVGFNEEAFAAVFD